MSDDGIRRALEIAGGTNRDAWNRFMVGVNGNGEIALLRPPVPGQPLTKSVALELAAWIVALANDDQGFADALKRVRET